MASEREALPLDGARRQRYVRFMKESFTSRGKGYAEIVRGARKMLELAMRTDPSTGRGMLTRDDVVTILEQVDDETHFADPMAQALLELIMERDGVVSFSTPGGRAGAA